MSVQEVIGLFTGVVGLAGVVWGIYRYRSARPKLRVTFSFAYPMLPDQGPEEFLCVTAANVSQRPFRLVGAGLRLSHRKTLAVINDYWWAGRFPANLPPGHSHSSYLKKSEVEVDLQNEANLLGRPVRVVTAFYRDGTGREWEAKVKPKLIWKPRRK